MARPPSFNRHQVAAITVEAIELGLPLVSTLALVLDTTEEKARTALRSARKGGFIGVGDHTPTRAVIHRNSSRERTFLVCDHCTTLWPCSTATKKRRPRP